MNQRTVLASLIGIADELDALGLYGESDAVTKIAAALIEQAEEVETSENYTDED